VLRYVTEGSFDGYSWQTVARKSEFIAQVMRGRLDVREIEDIGDAALSYNEVKALATGNPLLLDHAAAKAEVTRLERLERGHARSQARLPEVIGTSQDTIAHLTGQQEAIDTALAARRTTRGDAFAMTIGQRSYTDRSEAKEALIGALRGFERANPGIAHETRQPGFARLGGVEVTAIATPALGGRAEMAVQLDGIDDSTVPIRGQDWSGGIGVVTRLENQLGRLDELHQKTAETIAGARTEITRSEGQIGQPFPHAGELAAARAQLADIETDMARSAGHDPEQSDEPGSEETTPQVTEPVAITGHDMPTDGLHTDNGGSRLAGLSSPVPIGDALRRPSEHSPETTARPDDRRPTEVER
jgi:hypothetical protein